MLLQEVLYLQGFGTRRACAGIVQKKLLKVFFLEKGDEYNYCSSDEEVNPSLFTYSCMGVNFLHSEQIYIALYKPAGFECSKKPSAHPSIYTLLPQNLRDRPATKFRNEVQAVGRLDWDTTGLILLTDDGKFLHKITSPKSNLDKCYKVGLKYEMTEEQRSSLLSGIVLNDDPKPVRASKVDFISDLSCCLTINQGKYHQVKRMIAAVGNRVESLHRVSIGDFKLPENMSAGDWRLLSTAELRAFNYYG